MKYLKDKTRVTPEYIEKLKVYLLTHQEEYFMVDNEAKSFADFDYWPDRKIDRTHLCMPGEVMLIDRSYKGVHTYCICTISKSNRVTSEIPVIVVSALKYGIWRNGYFLLPELN